MSRIQINENVIYKKIIAPGIPESIRGAMFSRWLKLYPFKQIIRSLYYYETFLKIIHILPCCFLKLSWPNIICPFLSDSKLAFGTAVISWLSRGLWRVLRCFYGLQSSPRCAGNCACSLRFLHVPPLQALTRAAVIGPPINYSTTHPTSNWIFVLASSPVSMENQIIFIRKDTTAVWFWVGSDGLSCEWSTGC